MTYYGDEAFTALSDEQWAAAVLRICPGGGIPLPNAARIIPERGYGEINF